MEEPSRPWHAIGLVEGEIDDSALIATPVRLHKAYNVVLESSSRLVKLETMRSKSIIVGGVLLLLRALLSREY